MSMNTNVDLNLHDVETSTEFYDERYRQGYMERWPEEAMRQIADVVRALELPPEGTLLDFGCGNGVLTELLRRTLPAGWQVYGSDLSEVAIENAKKFYPGCTFFEPDSPALEGQRFDLVFTHHVLEHVYDLEQVAGQIQTHVKPGGAMLHIMPCGNEGSLEHQVCSLRRDGIDPDLGNRYFYEDPGHIRRLKSSELAELFAPHGFVMARAFFSNQYHGAIEWLTRSPGDVLRFTDPAAAQGPAERQHLARLRNKLVAMTIVRFPAHMFNLFAAKRRKRLRDYVLMAGALPFYPFSWIMDKTIRMRATQEWDARKTEPNGSAMFIYFTRSAAS